MNAESIGGRVASFGAVVLCLQLGACGGETEAPAVERGAQEILPFADPPMGGEVGPTMQESVHKWRETPSHLPQRRRR